MFHYAIANWIVLGISFISSFISMFTTFFSLQSIITEGDYSISEINATMLAPMIISLILIPLSIYSLIRYIQMLIALKKSGDQSQNQNLKASFKNELISIFITLLIPIFLVILILSFINIFLAEFPFDESVDPTSIESEIYPILMKIVLWVLLILVVAIVGLVFKVLAAVKLDNWAEELQRTYGNQMTPIKEGTNLIKWGQIAVFIPFLSTVATIIRLIGYTKAGKDIERIFAGEIQSQLDTSQGYFQSERTYQQKYQEDRCPYCGSPLPTRDAAFCTMCGKNLRS